MNECGVGFALLLPLLLQRSRLLGPVTDPSFLPSPACLRPDLEAEGDEAAESQMVQMAVAMAGRKLPPLMRCFGPIRPSPSPLPWWVRGCLDTRTQSFQSCQAAHTNSNNRPSRTRISHHKVCLTPLKRITAGG